MKWNEIEDFIKKSMNPLEDNSLEELTHMISVYREELYYQQQELANTSRAYKELFENAPIGYIVINKSLGIKKWNKRFSVISGKTSFSSFESLVVPQDQDKFYFFRKKLMILGTERCHLRILNNKNHEVPILLVGQRHPIEKDNYLLAVIDESREAQYRHKIQYLSYRDELTGLYNRRFAEEEIHRLDDDRRLPLSVVSIDINSLKLANDTLGHSFGDSLIQKTAEVITKISRKGDLVARVGGDEFLMVLPQTDAEQCREIVARYQEHKDHLVINDLPFTLSLGSATKLVPQDNIYSIIKEADRRMYANKGREDRKILVENLLKFLFRKSSIEEAHAQSVSALAERFGRALGLSLNDQEILKTAGLMHDIGKVSLDLDILSRESMVHPQDFDDIRRHSEVGYHILSSTNVFADIAPLIYAHHERVDGTGYPRQLRGDQIPYLARILSICDSYAEMLVKRPYKSALSVQRAIKELENQAGKQFDSQLVHAFIKHVLQEDLRKVIGPEKS